MDLFVAPSEDRQTGRRRIGGGGGRGEEEEGPKQRNVVHQAAAAAAALKETVFTTNKRKRCRRMYEDLFLNCELKEEGFKVVTGGIIVAPCRLKRIRIFILLHAGDSSVLKKARF